MYGRHGSHCSTRREFISGQGCACSEGEQRCDHACFTTRLTDFTRVEHGGIRAAEAGETCSKAAERRAARGAPLGLSDLLRAAAYLVQ